MKRFLFSAGMVLGLLGIVLCAVGLVAVWWSYPQLVRTTEQVQTRIDDTLDVVDGRLADIRGKVAEINAATLVFRKNLDEWLSNTSSPAEGLRDRAERLAGRARQLQDGLDTAQSLLEKARGFQRVAHPFQTDRDTSRIDQLLSDVSEIRQKVTGAADKLQTISQQLGDPENQTTLRSTVAKSGAEIVIIVKAIESAEAALERLSGRITDARSGAAELIGKIQRDLWWGRLIASLLILWMGLGQIVLSRVAWKRAFRGNVVGPES